MGTVSPFEIVRGDRPREPSPADVAAGMATLKACRGALEGLPRPVRGSVISSLIAEFLATWPESLRGEILRMMNTQASTALEFITSRSPDDAA